jgi:hypothetical protein
LLIPPNKHWPDPSCASGDVTVAAGDNPAPSLSPGILVFNIGHWEPKIGDPSFMGWFTVFSYYLCAGLSITCVLKSWPRMDGTDRRFRIFTTVVVLVLGLSKQFNLPAAVTEIGRIVANWMGGYELRRGLQVFMLLVVAVSLILLIRWAASHKAFPRVWQRFAPEMVCLCYLCGLVILRAISFHYIGRLLFAEVFGVRINWIAELIGIYALFVMLLIRVLAETRKGR